MNSWTSDIRYAARTLRKSPGFAMIAILTLAVGIGANAAIFSVLDSVLLRPLPYADGGSLVVLGDRAPEGGGSPGNVGFATYEDLRGRSRAFQQIAAVRSWYPTLVTDGMAERLPAMRVTANYFPMLGVSPALGRGFLSEEDRPDRWRVLILSDGLWRRSFGADPSVVGRVVRMNDQDYRIVGVMPRDFQPLVSARYYSRAQLWAPMGYDRSLPYACRSCQHLKAIGRLAPGVSIEQGRADLDGIRRRLAVEYPADYPAGSMDVVPLARELTANVRAPLLVLVGAVGFVLLIACANVANLMLARSLRRAHEMAVRGALGASRWRLIRQLLAESLVLCAAGGAVGLGLAVGLQAALLRLAPVSLPRMDHVAFDGRVVAFAALVSLAAALLSGWIPALRASSSRLPQSLASESRGSAGASSSGPRRLLTVVELTLAVVLVAGAFLMLRSVARLLEAPFGFDPDRVMTLAISLNGSAYAEDAPVARFQIRALERVRAIPDVESAAFAGQIPLGGNRDCWGFHIAGRMAANPSEDPSVERYSVTPDYFRTMGVPLRRGRLFSDEDRAESVPVMIVSEAAARELWPSGVDPIGERVRLGNPNAGAWYTVVGIVGDVRHVDVAVGATPQMYLPQQQVTDSFLTLVVKSPDRAARGSDRADPPGHPRPGPRRADLRRRGDGRARRPVRGAAPFRDAPARGVRRRGPAARRARALRRRLPFGRPANAGNRDPRRARSHAPGRDSPGARERNGNGRHGPRGRSRVRDRADAPDAGRALRSESERPGGSRGGGRPAGGRGPGRALAPGAPGRARQPDRRSEKRLR